MNGTLADQPLTDQHGWIWPRKDGRKAHCGGPQFCSVCQAEEAATQHTEASLESTGAKEAAALNRLYDAMVGVMENDAPTGYGPWEVSDEMIVAYEAVKALRSPPAKDA